MKICDHFATNLLSSIGEIDRYISRSYTVKEKDPIFDSSVDEDDQYYDQHRTSGRRWLVNCG